MTDAPFTRDTSGDGGGAYVTGTQFFAEASCRAGMPQILIEVYDESLPSCAPAGSPDLILILTARWTGAPGPIELEAGGPEGMIMLRDGFISFEGGVPVSISWAVDASLPPVLQGGGVDLRGECAVLGDLC